MKRELRKRHRDGDDSDEEVGEEEEDGLGVSVGVGARLFRGWNVWGGIQIGCLPHEVP